MTTKSKYSDSKTIQIFVSQTEHSIDQESNFRTIYALKEDGSIWTRISWRKNGLKSQWIEVGGES